MNGTGCIYGCDQEAPSTQEYHLYPASASTIDLVIEPGYVCDACNAYFSKVEDYFVHDHPGSSMRVWDGVETKKGKTPKFNHERGEVRREDADDGRKFTAQLGDLRFDRLPNGDLNIVGSYTPRPFDASKVSRVLHKIAFEFLLGFPENPQLNPNAPRFAALRDYVRRPKSRMEFQPFIWKRQLEGQRAPLFVSLRDCESDEWIADICELTFPGVAYVVAYPPWPASDKLWSSAVDAKVIRAPGMTNLEPEELTIPLHQVRD